MSHLQRLATQHSPVTAGERIYTAGDAFTAIYAVRFGAIKTVVDDSSGNEQIMAFHLPGEFFGLASIHAGCHRNTAIALQRSAVCSLSYQALESVADTYPALRRQLLRLMSGAILSEQGAYAAIAGHAAPARLAFLLLSVRLRMARDQPPPDRVSLPMSRADLGNSIGLTPETTSRVFTQFRRDGLIEASGRQVRFRNVRGLEALADAIVGQSETDQVPQNVAGTTSSGAGGVRSHSFDEDAS